MSLALRSAVLVAPLALVVMVGDERAAEACSCSKLIRSAPEDGATGVPLNSRVMVENLEYFGEEDAARIIRLRWADGEVELAPSTQQSGMIELVVPVALAADTAYEVTLDDVVAFGFTTGDAEDHAPPPTPTFTELGWYRVELTQLDSCYGHLLDTTDFALAGVDEPLVEIEFTSPALPPKTLHASYRYRFANGGCSGGFPQPAQGEPLCVSIAAVDLAGNRSPAVQGCVEQVVCEPRESCLDDGCYLHDCEPAGSDTGGCAASGRGASAIMAAALLALTLRRRRSRNA